MLQDGIRMVDWAVLEPATEAVTWSAAHHFGPYLARRVVVEARSDQSTGHVKPWHLYDCSDCILQIALLANKYSTLFMLNVLERDGWG